MSALDQLRESGRASVFSVRGFTALSGVLAVCAGLAVVLHDVFDPEPLLGVRVGLLAMAVGLVVIVVTSLLERRRHDRVAARLGVPRDQAEAIWREDDAA